MNLIELDAIEKIYSLGGETVRALDGNYYAVVNVERSYT